MISFLTHVPNEKFVLVYGEIGIWQLGLFSVMRGFIALHNMSSKLTPSERVRV